MSIVLENESRLQLEHPRRIDIGKCRDRKRIRIADGNKPTKFRGRLCAVAIHGYSAPEHVSVVKDIESFQAKIQSRPL